MSNYYKYNFVSPVPIYAIVKEELKSYFDTGAIDDLMFPIYLDKCIRKLEKSLYVISEYTLYIEDFQAKLPDNFYAVREAWMCSQEQNIVFQNGSSTYLQNAILLPKIKIDNCNLSCNDDAIEHDVLITNDCKEYPNDELNIVKINNVSHYSFYKQYLLKPGNISANINCTVDYSNNLNNYGEQNYRNFTPNSSTYNSFDIRDNKFITNFRKGIVHLMYYSDSQDCEGNQLIPDNFRVQEYIEAFLKYKVFETLTNQVNDETFNQLQQKLIYYEQKYNEAYIMVNIEVKKETIYKKQQTIKEQNRRFNRYRY